MKFYLKIPGTNYVSRFAGVFRGCFGCGSDTHQFRACRNINNPEVKRKFYLYINTHVPSTRLRRNTTLVEHTVVQSNSLLANYLIHINPSSSNSNSIIKRARFCPIFDSVNNISQATKKPMPQTFQVQVRDFIPFCPNLAIYYYYIDIIINRID